MQQFFSHISGDNNVNIEFVNPLKLVRTLINYCLLRTSIAAILSMHLFTSDGRHA